MSLRARYVAVRALLDVQFWFPVWYWFLLARGFSVGEAALADGVFRAVVTVAEVPLGRVVDWIGRRAAMRVGTVGTAVTFACITTVHTVPGMLVAWVAWGVVWAMSSGLDTAYGWEIAVLEGEPQPGRYLGRLRLVTGLATFVSLLTAGWLFAVDVALPFAVTAGLAVLAVMLVWTLPDTRELEPETPRSAEVRALTTDPVVRSAIAAAALVLVAGWTVQVLFQPLAVDLGISTQATGLIYAAFALARGLGGWLGARFVPIRGAAPVLVAVVALSCLATAALWRTAPWLIALTVLPTMGFAHAAAATITDIGVAGAVTTRTRATALSLVSCAAGLVMVVGRPGLTLLSGSHGAGAGFGLWGVVCLLLVPCLALVTRRPQRTEKGPAVQ